MNRPKQHFAVQNQPSYGIWDDSALMAAILIAAIGCTAISSYF